MSFTFVGNFEWFQARMTESVFMLAAFFAFRCLYLLSYLHLINSSADHSHNVWLYTLCLYLSLAQYDITAQNTRKFYVPGCSEISCNAK